MTPARAKLLAALRSNTYKQIKTRLHVDGCFCAMGVACEISGLGTWINGIYTLPEGAGSVACAPQDVLRHYGLNIRDEDEINLRNDSDWSFTAIADWLEGLWTRA